MALSEFFERQREYQSSRSQVSARAEWSKGATVPNVRSRSSDLIQTDPDASSKIAALISQVYPVIAGAFNRRIGPVAKTAFAKWPVATGRSKSELDLEFDVQGESLVARIVCRAWYAGFIREPTGTKRREPRRFTPEEVAMISRPPKNVEATRAEWKQAIAVASRMVDSVSYAYAVATLKRIRAKEAKNKKPKRGKKVSDVLVFRPGMKAAELIESDIANGVSK